MLIYEGSNRADNWTEIILSELEFTTFQISRQLEKNFPFLRAIPLGSLSASSQRIVRSLVANDLYWCEPSRKAENGDLP